MVAAIVFGFKIFIGYFLAKILVGLAFALVALVIFGLLWACYSIENLLCRRRKAKKKGMRL